ncbi:MAG TPA: carboxypeptidase-like regulatory domain-containing protein [Vicinamibacterales bacterium]|nr:carboxypeptidase-like regulatory domain-containing protein [Vicinamibacterales bacterium]
MTHRTPALIAGLLLVIVMPAAPALAQPAQTSADPKAKPTGVIRGRVTAADTGRPLRRAQITVAAPDRGERRTTATNSRGEYEVAELPAARYSVSVSRSGYLPLAYGTRLPGEPGRPVDLADADTAAGIDFALPRSGVISGRIVDETGDPVSGVTVWVMRYEYFRRRRTLVPTGSNTRTDDTGQYRATGVMPGEYLVVAMLRETWTVGGKEPKVYGYAPTYAPSTASAGEARRVRLTAGKEAPNVDITLVAAAVVSISGVARRSDGTPLANTSVSLGQNVIGPSSQSFAGVGDGPVGADGGWRIKNVPPGEYELSVSAQGPLGREAAAMKIVVQGTDIEGVALTTEAPVTVTGEIAMESGALVPDPPTGRLRVTVETIGDQPQTLIPSSDDNGLVKSDGRFTVKSISGPAIVRVSSLPRGMSIKSVEVDGREVPDGVLELKGGQALDSVRIVVTDRFPVVTGAVTDDRGAAADGAVLLFPSDESRWIGVTDNTRLTRTSAQGAFRLTGVRPGEYFAIAVPSIQPWQTADPEFLGSLKDRATRIAVHEGEAAQISLKLPR